MRLALLGDITLTCDGGGLSGNFKRCLFNLFISPIGNPDPDQGKQRSKVQSYLGLLLHF